MIKNSPSAGPCSEPGAVLPRLHGATHTAPAAGSNARAETASHAPAMRTIEWLSQPITLRLCLRHTKRTRLHVLLVNSMHNQQAGLWPCGNNKTECELHTGKASSATLTLKRLAASVLRLPGGSGGGRLARSGFTNCCSSGWGRARTSSTNSRSLHSSWQPNTLYLDSSKELCCLCHLQLADVPFCMACHTGTVIYACPKIAVGSSKTVWCVVTRAGCSVSLAAHLESASLRSPEFQRCLQYASITEGAPLPAPKPG